MSQPWVKEYQFKKHKSIRAQAKDAVKTFLFAGAMITGIYVMFLRNSVKRNKSL